MNALTELAEVIKEERRGAEYRRDEQEKRTKQAEVSLQEEKERSKRARKWQVIAVIVGVVISVTSCIGQCVQAYYAAHPQVASETKGTAK